MSAYNILIIDDSLEDLIDNEKKLKKTIDYLLPYLGTAVYNSTSLKINGLLFRNAIQIEQKSILLDYDVIFLDIKGNNYYSGSKFIESFLRNTCDKNVLHSLIDRIIFLSDYPTNDFTVNSVLSNNGYTTINERISKIEFQNCFALLNLLNRKLFINNAEISRKIYELLSSEDKNNYFKISWTISKTNHNGVKVTYTIEDIFDVFYFTEKKIFIPGNDPEIIEYTYNYNDLEDNQIINPYLIKLYKLEFNMKFFRDAIKKYEDGSDKRKCFASFQGVVINLIKIKEFKLIKNKKILADLQMPITTKKNLFQRLHFGSKDPNTLSFGSNLTQKELEEIVNSLNDLIKKIHYQF